MTNGSKAEDRVAQLEQTLESVSVEIAGAMLALADPRPLLARSRLNDALDIINSTKAEAASE